MIHIGIQPPYQTDLFAKRSPLKDLSRLCNNLSTLTMPIRNHSYSTLCQTFQSTFPTESIFKPCSCTPSQEPPKPKFAHSKQKFKRLKSVNQSALVKHPSIRKCQMWNHTVGTLGRFGLNQQQDYDFISCNQNSSTDKGFVLSQSLVSTAQIKHLTVLRSKGLETCPWQQKLFDSMSYKMAVSHVVLGSRQNIRIEESVMEERSILQNFVLIKKIIEDEYLSVEKETGLYLVVKIRPLHTASSSLAIVNEVTPQHPNIVRQYRTMADNQWNTLTLKEFFEEYLCESTTLRPPQEISSFIRQIFLLFCDLSKIGLTFEQQVYESVVLINGVCKINNLSCIVVTDPQTKLFPLLVNFINRLIPTSNNEQYKSVLKGLVRHISKCNSFNQIKDHSLFQY